MGSVSLARHCSIGLAIRLCLIVYGNYHDRIFDVPYTDVDYRVYTDASRLLANGESPYDRHTYRYTALLAAILTPNVLLHSDFGKVLFSVIDIAVTLMIARLLSMNVKSTKREDKSFYSLLWLYNPLTIVITTRGNADSLAVLLVLASIYYLRKGETTIAGIFHGLGIHFRLYPIVFSLTMYLVLRDKNRLLPNLRQIKLVIACATSLALFTLVNYYLYGNDYLYESIVYHLVRKDPRHNFSVYFYGTYLSEMRPYGIAKRLAAILSQLVPLFAVALRYSNPRELPFAMFCQAMLLVTYNSVVTSQYFLWYLSLLPICLPDIRMSRKRLVATTVVWLLGQAVWLLDAYFLEFRGVNMFYGIWLSGILFFACNIKVLRDCIARYECGAAIKLE